LIWTATFVIAVCLFKSCETKASVRVVKPNKARVIYGKGHGKDVALWVARSCVGEAGFDSGESGECAAIAHIYRKRTKVTQFNLYQVTRRYSAAIKKGPHQKRKWVFYLCRDLKKPKYWSKGLHWPNYRDKWASILKLCDDFIAGKVLDPIPHADHYGGRMDRHRAKKWNWYKLDTPDFKNHFWSVTCPKRKEKNDA